MKRRLCDEVKKLIPGAILFRLEDKFTGGIPDCAITAFDRTVWVEVKYRRAGSPALLTPLQRATLSRLIKHGRALVVTYVERKDHTLVIEIDRPTLRKVDGETSDECRQMNIECGKSFNHVAVAEVILQELQR